MRGVRASRRLTDDVHRPTAPRAPRGVDGEGVPVRRREFGVELQRSAPQLLPPHTERRTQHWREWVLGLKRPRAVDLFCGGGGLSLGLEEAGYKVILAVDGDPWAVQTHAHNFAGLALEHDLSRPETVELLTSHLRGLPVDLIAGGPPCQPFSRAGRPKIRSLVDSGRRDEFDGRSELWMVFIRLVELVRPNAVLMENVPDMALGDDLSTVREIISRLEIAGYDADVRLVDAWRFGVPQHRQRLILLASRYGTLPAWPAEGKRIVTLSEAISDLPRLGNTTGAPEMRYGRPQTAFQRKARRGAGAPVVRDHVTRPVRDDDRRAFQLLRPGMRYNELPEELRRYRDDIFDDKYNRLAWDQLSRTITAHIAKDGYWYIHPSESRTLTVREAARIQTFPDRFRFAGTRSHAFHQIGNAVPPALACAVAKQLLRASRSSSGARESRRDVLLRIRKRLLGWAAADARRNPWRHPGDPWRVLVGVVLAPRPSEEAVREVVDFLQICATPASVTPARIDRILARAAKRGRTERSLRRLLSAALVLRGTGAWEKCAWASAADLGPADELFVRVVGLREDGIVASASALRVAARLTGRPVDVKNRLSQGKMVLGTIIGSGESVPSLNAALTVLGSTVCTVGQPSCDSCPLSADCSHAQRRFRSRARRLVRGSAAAGCS